MTLALPPTSCKVNTPPELAKAMVKALGNEPGLSWLEPSHGSGVFVQAIAELGVRKKHIVAIDLDPTPSDADRLATTFRRVDFLQWAQATSRRFDRIVGNPPFISIKRLKVSLRKTAAAILDMDGTPIGISANVWYAFVLASLRVLKKGGSLAFVLPSAAEFSSYSAAIRDSLHDTFQSLELYRCTRPLFDAVQEGTVVAIARGYRLGPCKVRRKRFSKREQLIEALSESGKVWGRRCRPRPAFSLPSLVQVKSIARVRLGGVTGDASFFLMNEDTRKKLRLPTSAFTPVISKARHLRFSKLERHEWNELRNAGERVWLFNPTPLLVRRESRIRNYMYPREGGCNRNAYKVATRRPWYRTPLLTRADAFMSGMCQHGPWLCINEFSKLRATNTLYVLKFFEQFRDERYMWALAFLTSISQRQIRGIGRHYADGLVKYEPGPLSEVELPRLNGEADHRQLYELAIRALQASDMTLAKNIADSARL